jgi:hypothetical protein
MGLKRGVSGGGEGGRYDRSKRVRESRGKGRKGMGRRKTKGRKRGGNEGTLVGMQIMAEMLTTPCQCYSSPNYVVQ